MMRKKEGDISDVFPNSIHSVTHPYDKLESLFVDIPIIYIKRFIGRFRFLQNGNPQFYILYGMVFIFIVMAIPFISDIFYFVAELLNQI